MATDTVEEHVMKQQRRSAIPVVITLILISVLHLLLSNALNVTPQQIIATIFSPALNYIKQSPNIARFFDGSMFFLEQSLIILAFLNWRAGKQHWRQKLIFANMLITLELIVRIISLVIDLLEPNNTTGTSAYSLLWDALILWPANVGIFAVWYWLLDGDRETSASQHAKHNRHFSFPRDDEEPAPSATTQQDGTHTPKETNGTQNQTKWRPRLLCDYLFLAFNTSTAFSPTDTPVRSWRAQVLMMVQSTISLVILVTIVARAINIIGNNR
jgi:uncharacterized membrane protein